MAPATGPMGCSVHSCAVSLKGKRPSTGWAGGMRVLCARNSSIGGSPPRPSPVSLGMVFCQRIKTLLADAEPGEDLSEQLVGVELTRDCAERAVRKPQLLGEKLPPSLFGG